MLDVHPPHAPTHTWKDFFIHIATIVVGLLIAVALEQTVEWLHHRHQAEQARELILDEVKTNSATLEDTNRLLDHHVQTLQADLVALDHLRHHALQPQDRILFIRTSNQFHTSAWSASHQSNAVDYLSHAEVHHWEELYESQARIETFNIDAKNNLIQTTAVLHTAFGGKPRTIADLRKLMRTLGDSDQSPMGETIENITDEDLQRLTPGQVDRLEQGLQIGISQDEQMLRWCIDLETTFGTP